MKKNLLFISMLIIASCSTSEESSESETTVQNQANFSITKNIARPDWSNIQVGETLKLDIKIKDFDNSPDVAYVLKPINLDATKHQRNKIDYYFQQEIKVARSGGFLNNTKDSILVKTNRDSIVLKKANDFFYIYVLKPGNFSHQYELRKMKAGKYVAGTVQDFLFSAVKLNVYTWNKQTDNSTVFQSSKHSRFYEFTIDDGDQTNDTYLTDSEYKKQTYSADYNGKIYTGVVAINQILNFSEKVNTEKGAQIVPSWEITELKITQKRTGELDNIITYNNLVISQK